MAIIEISDPRQREMQPYSALTERMARKEGVMIVESPKVIERALAAGVRPLSLLCEEKHIEGDAAGIIAVMPQISVYTASREILSGLTGYTLTRGVLCAMERPPAYTPERLLSDSRRLCVLYDVSDSTNVGVIFRTAVALGFDGLLLSRSSCDPYGRRASRVSMGTVFQAPWCYVDDVVGVLHENNFELVAMALSDDSVFLEDFTVDASSRYAVVMGSEGYGLPPQIMDACDHVVKIRMHYGVDSLNVGAAAAISLWHFRPLLL